VISTIFGLMSDDTILSQNVTEKFKLKLWALLTSIAIRQNCMKQTQHNLTECTFKKKKIDNYQK